MEAFLQHPFRPCIPRKTRCNNVERRMISRNRRQERQYLRHLEEASWPCMYESVTMAWQEEKGDEGRTTVDEQQRDGTLSGTPLVHIMHT